MLSALAFGLVALPGFSAIGEDDKKSEYQVVQPKVVPGQKPAIGINFSGELGIAFPTLATLGVRIDFARRDGDPVGLASAANELAAAEAVAGKTTELTASALMGEAVALAKLRSLSSELKAVGILCGDSKLKAELDALAVTAARAEREREAAVKAGEMSRGLQGTLTVRNLTPEIVDVYLNGQYQGTIQGYGTGRYSAFHSESTNSVFEMKARSGKAGWSWILVGAVKTGHPDTYMELKYKY